MRLAAVNGPAQEAGLRPNLLLTEAKALCPDLEADDYCPQEDLSALKAISDWCHRYSPWSAPAQGASGQDGVFIDFTGCAHLFGGEQGWVEDLLYRLSSFGLHARAGLADTPGAAWALARFGRMRSNWAILAPGNLRKAMVDLPVAALRLEPSLVEGLEAVGLKRVGDIIDMPRQNLTKRFGTSIAHRLDQALGVDEEPICPQSPLVPYRARRALGEPIVTEEAVSQGIREIARDLCARMIEEGVGARRLRLELYRTDGARRHLEIGTSRPCHQPDHIESLFAKRLSEAVDDLEGGLGIDALSLNVLEAEQSSPTQLAIAASTLQDPQPGQRGKSKAKGTSHPQRRRPDEALGRLVDHLGNRLGLENVYQMSPANSHLPEEAMALTPLSASPGSNSLAQGEQAEAFSGKEALQANRPIGLLPGPEPIDVLAEIPDGPPRHFKWRRQAYRIVRFEGPERIAPPWWKSKERSQKTRDYYRVEDEKGRRFWLCRHGLYERETVSPNWYVHGVFA